MEQIGGTFGCFGGTKVGFLLVVQHMAKQLPHGEVLSLAVGMCWEGRLYGQCGLQHATGLLNIPQAQQQVRMGLYRRKGHKRAVVSG